MEQLRQCPEAFEAGYLVEQMFGFLRNASEEGAASQGSEDAIAGLSEALLERDRYTGEHSDSVVSLVAGVARGLGLPEAEVERVMAAAKLHDIGKVAIPDHILNSFADLPVLLDQLS